MDIVSPKKRSEMMSNIGGKNTKPEMLLRSMLHREGYRFRLHVKELPGKPDIVLPKYRTVIEVRGCFWHRHQNCRYATTPKTRREFWQAKFDSNVARDKENLRKLQQMGWETIVVWECELKSKPGDVLMKVTKNMKEIQN